MVTTHKSERPVSSSAGPQATYSNEATRPVYSNDEGVPPGWRTFAGVMILIAAIWNILDGVIAVANASYYSSVASGRGIHLPITDSLTTWGWVAIAVGLVMVAVAFGVFADAMWAQVVGVIAVGVNIIFQLGFLASFPLWSLVLIGLDVCIIYGLTVPSPAQKSRF